MLEIAEDLSIGVKAVTSAKLGAIFKLLNVSKKLIDGSVKSHL